MDIKEQICVVVIPADFVEEYNVEQQKLMSEEYRSSRVEELERETGITCYYENLNDFQNHLNDDEVDVDGSFVYFIEK